MRVSRHCRNVRSGSVIGTLSFGWDFNPETQVVTVLYTFCQELRVTRGECWEGKIVDVQRLDTFRRHVASLHLEGKDIELREEVVESENVPNPITVRSEEIVDFQPMKLELSLDYLQQLAAFELNYNLIMDENGFLEFKINPQAEAFFKAIGLLRKETFEEEPISMSSFLEFLMLDLGIIGTRYHYITEKERIAINWIYGGPNCEILPERSFGRD